MASPRKVVLKIGGSVLVPSEASPDTHAISGVISVLRDLNRSMLTGVVVGGGKINSAYVDAGRKLGMNQYQLDQLGIEISRINAKLLASSAKFALQRIPESVEEASALMEKGKVVVMGGVTPGQTTDAVAALWAENLGGARLVITTNVDGVYDKDPAKHGDAKKFDLMAAENLVKLANLYDSRGARENFVVDLLAAKIIKRSGIETHIISGKDLKSMKNAALGKPHKGTVVD
jgi:uridylate kinase